MFDSVFLLGNLCTSLAVVIIPMLSKMSLWTSQTCRIISDSDRNKAGEYEGLYGEQIHV